MEIQTIVERLNAPPFNKGLSLVAFDEKGPAEVLQLLNDVFAELDRAHKVDVRDETAEIGGPRMLGFLQLLKFPLPPDPAGLDRFQAALVRGERAAVYPVLAYVLTRFVPLKKRAYVARYLLPVDLPPDMGSDPALLELLGTYRQLQGEFKETHKALDKATGGGAAPRPVPSELRREITQLEGERGQLVDKITALKRKTSDMKGFAPLLEATSALRREQEEEGRLSERLQEQRISLAAAERRYAEVNRRLAETRATCREDLTGEEVLAAARRECGEARQLVRQVLPASLAARRETLGRLQRQLAEPVKSESDLHALKTAVAQAEASVANLTAQVAAAQRAAGDDKLAMFRQQTALVAKKLMQKEEALELLTREADALGREVEAKEAKLGELIGPKYMRREEFKAYAASLRAKAATFKQLKGELAELRQETVVLARTEAILKTRAGDLEAFLKKMEERKGITGYTTVQSDLERISALKARIDESKGKALGEISRLVEEINRTIKDKKARLAPLIKQLRADRAEFAEVEGGYVRERATYENVAAGLEAEKLALERQADALQAEAVGEESRVFVLQAQAEATVALTERAREEAAYERGEGRFLRDFTTLKELYAHKLSQLEALAKELRKKQRDMQENSGAHSLQRAKFAALQKLLAAKSAHLREEGAAALGAAKGGGVGGRDLLCLGDGEGKFAEEGPGGVNVMRL